MWIYECVKYSLINHSLPYSANCVISVRTMIAAQTVAANNWCLIHIVATVNYFVCRASLHHPQECTNIAVELENGDVEWLSRDRAVLGNIVLTAHLTSLRQVLQYIRIIVVYSFALFHYLCPSFPHFYALSQNWETGRFVFVVSVCASVCYACLSLLLTEIAPDVQLICNSLGAAAEYE